MRRKTVTETTDNMFSPAVDCLANAMLMMFVYAILFVLFMKQEEPKPPYLLACDLPPCGGAPYQFTFPVVNGLGERTFSVEGPLPARLRLDQKSGTLYGIAETGKETANSALSTVGGFLIHNNPLATAICSSYCLTNPSRATIRVRVADRIGTHARDYTLELKPTVLPADPEDAVVRLLRSGGALRTGRVGTAYEEVIGARGGVGPLEWKVVAGSPPPGLSPVDGRIAGTPTAPGRFTFEVEACSAEQTRKVGDSTLNWKGTGERKAFALEVLPPLKAEEGSARLRAGEPYQGRLFSSRLLPGESVRDYRGVPRGLTPTPDGLLHGTSEESGTFTIVARIVDRTKVLAEVKQVLTVLARRPVVEAGNVAHTAYAGEKLDFRFPYRGLVEPVKLAAVGRLPEGLGVAGPGLSGTPQRPGTAVVNVDLTDAAGTKVRGTWALTVLPPRQPLGIDTPEVLDCVVGRPVRWRLPVVGGEAPAEVKVAGSLPTGLTASSGVITGTPKEAGRWEAKVTATDPVTGRTAQRPLVIRAGLTVSDPLRIVTQKLPLALVGEDYEVALACTGAAGDVKWATDGPLPPGLSLEGGVLRGRVSTEGNHPFKVSASDGTGRTSGPHELAVIAERPERSKPVVVTRSLPAGSPGHTYAADLASEGGLGRHMWKATGNLPPGLALTGNRLAGTPTAAATGRWKFSVRVSDERGDASDPRELTLEIDGDSLREFRILTGRLPPALVGQAYEVVLTSVGAAGPVRWQAIGLPEGLRLDGSAISGAATTEGKRTIALEATDGAGRRAPPRTVDLEAMRAEGGPPEVVTRSLPPALTGKPYTVYLASEGGLGRYGWTVKGSLPPGLSLKGNRLEGTPTPAARGKWSFDLEVSDERGSRARAEGMTLEVEAPPPAPAPTAVVPGESFPSTVVYVGASLLAVLLLVGAVVVWSASRRREDKAASVQPAGASELHSTGEEILQFRCPNKTCNRPLQAPVQRAGQRGRCPYCQQEFVAPQGPRGKHR